MAIAPVQAIGSKAVFARHIVRGTLSPRRPKRREYDADVSGDDLNPEQATRLTAIVARQLRFLNRLCRRMDLLGFPLSDPLWQAAIRARHSLQDLHVAAHYAGCRHGVGRRQSS